MANRIFDLVFYGIVFSMLFPIGLLVKQFKHQPSEMRWLMFTLLLSFTCDMIAEISDQFRVFFVNLGSIIYGIAAPFFFAYFFVHCFQWKKWNVPLIVAGLCMSIFCLNNSLFVQKQAINSWSATLLSLFILAMSIVYFYKLITELPTDRIQDLPLFWIISSFFFTHAGKLVLVAVSTYMTTIMKDNLVVLWTAHNILSLVGVIALSWGVWLHTKGLRKNIIKLQTG